MPIDRDGDGPPLRREDEPRAKPNDGLRASPFTEDVFDDEYYGRRPRRTGGISFGVITGVVFFAAIVAAAGWYILAERSAPSTVAGGGEMVRADAAPYKIKPEDPGGLQVANQDKLIYDDRLAKGPAPKHAENLLPAPEEPRAPPVKAPEPKVEAKPEPPKAEAKAEPAPEPKTETAAAKPASDPMAELMAKVEGMKKSEKTETPPPEPMTPAPPVAAAPSPGAAPAKNPMLLVPASDAPAPEKPAAVVADAAPVAPAPTPAASAAVPTAVGPAVPGAVYIQLASARSEEGALSEWKRISGKNADLLANLSPTVAQAEVPDKGTFFRLRAGPIADRPAAQELCAGLIARGLTCLIVR